MKIELLADRELLSATKNLVLKEREILTSVLKHLSEIDRRRLYSDLGYDSLFEYAVKELHYSESEASRRLNAMRLSKEIPAVRESIARGELSLSNASQAQQLFRKQKNTSHEKPFSKEQKIEVLDALKNKSTREGQKVLLEIHPQAIARKVL